MPKGRPNSYSGGGFIKSMREKHEPHMKLAGRVEGLEKDIPIAINELHKTLSKSFGMQRKTLMRVIELEKQTAGITIIIEEIQEGFEDVIRGRRRRRRRGRPSAKRPPKGEGTPKDWDEEVPGDWDGTDGTDQIGDKEPEQAVIGEPELGIDPTSDLQPEQPGSGDEGEPTQPDDEGEPTQPDDEPTQPDDEGEPTQPDDESTQPDDTQSGLGISKELENIRSSISELSTDTRSVLEKVLNLDNRVSINEKKISLIKEILKAERSDIGENISDLEPDTDTDTNKIKSPLDESIQNIADSVTSIHQTLLDEQDKEEDQMEDAAVDIEQAARDDKEKGREGAGKAIAAGLKKTGEKMLKPVKSIIDKIIDFIIKIAAAKYLSMFMDWFGDPANVKKVQSIVRFIKDWWPSLLTGILLFAGSMLGPVGIIAGITLLITGFIPRIVDSIKQLFGFTKDTEKEAKKGEKLADKALKGEEEDKMYKVAGGAYDKDYVHYGPADQDAVGAGWSMKEQRQKQEQMTKKKNFNKGGEVPGTGNKDTVPAMLTPGEFVMSKGAVEQYGVDTLEGMNAAAGGTNEPKEVKNESKEVRPGLKGGGLAGFGGGGSIKSSKLFGYSGGGEVKEDPKGKNPKLNEGSGRLARRIETGKDSKSPLMSIVEKHPMVMMFKGIMKNPIIKNIISNVGDALGGDKEDPQLDLTKAIADLQERFNYSIYEGNYKPAGGAAPVSDGDSGDGGGGGNPLDGFIAAISKVPLVGKPIAKVTGLLVDGVEDMIVEKLKLSDTQSGTATPDAPTPPTTTVAYQQMQQAQGGGGSIPSTQSTGGKVPDFSAGAKVDSRKIKVLGITR